MNITKVILLALVFLLIAWDFFAYYVYKNVTTKTISVTIWESAKKYPIIGVGIGVVIGHIFWS